MTKTCTTKRAAKGGEVAPNGEFYEGGRFINTVAENAKKEGSKPARKFRVEVEPYTWVEADGRRPIYGRVAGLFGKVVGGVMVIDTSDKTLAYFGETRESVEAMAARYNAGERWM